MERYFHSVIWHNVPLQANIVQLAGNYIEITDGHSTLLKIPLTEHDCHLYLPRCMFVTNGATSSSNGCSALTSTSLASWPEKLLIDRVNTLVCEYSNLRGKNTFSERNRLWSDYTNKELGQTVSWRQSCGSRVKPQPTVIVTLTSLQREFKNIVCAGHLLFMTSASFMQRLHRLATLRARYPAISK